MFFAHQATDKDNDYDITSTSDFGFTQVARFLCHRHKQKISSLTTIEKEFGIEPSPKHNLHDQPTDTAKC